MVLAVHGSQGAKLAVLNDPSKNDRVDQSTGYSGLRTVKKNKGIIHLLLKLLAALEGYSSGSEPDQKPISKRDAKVAKAKAYVKTARGVQKSTNDALKKHNDSVKIRREELLERQEARDKKVEISADSDAKAFTGKPE